MKIMKLIMLISIFGVMCGCAEISKKEILRKKSPDGVVDFVLTEISGDATLSNGYLLYIVPSGKIVDGEKPILRGDHFVGLDVKWKEAKFLTATYKEGRIFSFSNFWQSKEVNNFSYVVEIRLNPLTESFSLSDQDRWIE